MSHKLLELYVRLSNTKRLRKRHACIGALPDYAAEVGLHKGLEF